MKKTILALAAVIMMSATAVAQGDNQQSVRRDRRPVDQTEMMEKRTEAFVKTYGLNEEQAAKVLELNKQYAGKIGGPRFGHRGGRPEGRAERPDSMMKGQRPPRPEAGRGGFDEMRKSMEAYDAELQKIMTEEQFKAYKADQQKRFQQGGRRPNGMGRPHRDNNNNND